MAKSRSSSAAGKGQARHTEAAETQRTFEANPADGSALLRLCTGLLAMGDKVSIQEALSRHVHASSGGSRALRLRLSKAGEILPEQRAELLVQLSYVEAEKLGDENAALASTREALKVHQALASDAGSTTTPEEVTDPGFPCDMVEDTEDTVPSFKIIGEKIEIASPSIEKSVPRGDEPLTDPAIKRPPLDHIEATPPDPSLERQCKKLMDLEPTAAMEALTALKESCTRDVDKATVYRAMGHIREGMNDKEGALLSLAEAGRLAPSDRKLLDEQLRLAVMTGAYAELAKSYRDALRHPLAKADRIYLHLKLGHLYARELARPEAATEHYERVMALEPQNVEALRRLGEILARQGRWTEVIDIKKRELETVWANSRDLAHTTSVKRELARLYEEKIGDRESALRLYREVLSVTPENPAILAGIERLREQSAVDETGKQAFAILENVYSEARAYERLTDLYSQAAREALGADDPVQAADLHRRAAISHEKHLEDGDRAFVELVRASQILSRAGKQEQADFDSSRAGDIAVAIFEDLLRIGQAAGSFEQSVAAAEDLAMQLGGTRGAALLVRLADTEKEETRTTARLARAVEISGGDPDLESRLEDLYVSQGNWKELAVFYRTRADRVADRGVKADLLSRLAEVLEDEIGDVTGAARVYEEITELAGSGSNAQVSLFRLLEEQQSWTDLVKALEWAVEESEDVESKKSALLQRARVHQDKLGDPLAARADWQRALTLDPRCAEAIQGMAETVSETDNAREAAIALESSLSGLSPGQEGRAEGFRRLAHLYGDVLQQPSKAKLAWEEVQRELPDDDDAFENLRALYRERGNLDSLAHLLDDRLNTRPRDADAKLWRRERIDALEKLGRGEEAGEEWQKAAEDDPTDLEAQASLAAFHTARHNWSTVVDVIGDWLEAASDEDEKADLHARLAEIHRHEMNDEDKAVAEYEKALCLSPSHTSALTALTDIFRQRGELHKMLPLLESRLNWATEPRERAITLAEVWVVGRRLGEAGDDDARARAGEALQEACLLAPGDPRLWTDLEETLTEECRFSELAGYLEARAARLEGGERANSLLKAAKALHRVEPQDQRIKERTRRCLERARDSASDGHTALPEVLDLLRAVYEESGAWEALGGVLEQMACPEVTDDTRQRSWLLNELSLLLADRLDRPAEASGPLEELLKITSDDAERDSVLSRLISLHGNLGDWHTVRDLIDQRARLHQGTDREAELHLTAAEIAEKRLSNHEAALHHLRSALAARPTDDEIIERLECLCKATGQNEAHALILSEEGLRADDPARKTELLLRAAVIKARLGNLEGARQDIEAFMAMDGALESPSPDRIREVSELLSTLRAFDDLIIFYEKLLDTEADPASKAELWVDLGMIREEHLCDQGKALSAYEQALKLDPKSARALAFAGRLAETRGDLDTALELRMRQADVAETPSSKAGAYCAAAGTIENRDKKLALELYEKAFEADARSTSALRGQLRLLEEQKRSAEAIHVIQTLADLSEDPVESCRLWTDAGEMLEATEDSKGASKCYEMALNAVPDYAQACTALARLHLEEGAPTAALTLLELAADRLDRENDSEGLASAYRQIASVHEAIGQLDEARRKLQAAYHLRPTRRDTLESLAWQLSASQDHVRSHEVLCSLLENHEQSFSKSEKASVLRRMGLSLAAMGRYGDAAGKLDEALRLAPKDRDVLVALANTYEDAGRWAEAIRVREKLLALSRRKQDRRRLSLEIAHLWAGKLHDASHAAEVLKDALEEHPDDSVILERLASEQEKNNAYQEAAVTLEKLLEKESGNSYQWVRLGKIHHEHLDNPERAIESFRKAVELSRREEDVQEALKALRDVAAATRDARPLAEMLAVLADRGGDTEPHLLRELAEVQRYQIGDCKKALAHLERAVTLEPEHTGTLEDVARLYERDGRDEDAVLMLRRVLRISPFDIDALRSLLRVLQRQNRNDGAAMVASILSLLDSNDTDIQRLRANLPGPPDDGPSLPEGPNSPELIHPHAAGATGRLLAAIGSEGLTTFERKRSKEVVLDPQEKSNAALTTAAISVAARILRIPEFRVELGGATMPPRMAPTIGFPPRVLVSPRLINSAHSIEPAELRFQAARAVMSTLPEMLAGLALHREQLEILLSAALALTGVEKSSEMRTDRAAKRMEDLVSDRRKKEIAEAAGHYQSARDDERLDDYIRGVEYSVIRAGLFISGSPHTALQVLQQEGLNEQKITSELVSFALSEEHLALRAKLGWSAGLK